MPNLFPSFEMPSLAELPTSRGVQYPESCLFDFAAGDAVIDGAGRVVMADGLTAWAQWCQKAVMTERFSFLAYSNDYGSELESARSQPTRAGVQSEIERTITETLLADPRTQLVTDFTYTWQGDSVWVAFTVIPVIGSEQRLEVLL